MWKYAEVTPSFKKDLKVILKLDWNTPSEQVLATTKWPTLKSMYTKTLLSLSYNCYHGHAPTQLQNLFVRLIIGIISEITILSNYRLPKQILMKNSSVYRASSIWNTLDNDTKIVDNISTFKTNIRNSHQ